MDRNRKDFEDSWKEMAPLYFQAEPRLTMKEIGEKMGITASQVSRIARTAQDRKLVNRRAGPTQRTVFRGIPYGSMSAAVLPHAAANTAFKDWLTMETTKNGFTVSELAVAALLDVFYEETSF